MACRLRTDLITAFKIFTGVLDVDPKLFFFSLPSFTDLEDIPTMFSKVRATTWGEGQLFKWGLWNIGISRRFRRHSYFCQIFKKRLEKVWTDVFPHLPHWLKSHHTTSLTLPPPNWTPLINSLQLYMLPCFVYVVSSGPLWITFLPLYCNS